MRSALQRIALIAGASLPVFALSWQHPALGTFVGGDGKTPSDTKKYECYTGCDDDADCPEVVVCHASGGQCIKVRRDASFYCDEVENGSMRSCDTKEVTVSIGGEQVNEGCVLSYKNPCDTNQLPSCYRIEKRCGKKTKCD